MANQNVTTVLDKWDRNLSGAAQSYTAGVQAVTQSPTQQAARNLDRAANNYLDAVTSGRMASALNNVSLSDWQQAAIAGAGRLAAGAKKGRGKMQKFLGAWLPVAAQISDQVAQMPKGTTEDALARVRVSIERAKQFAGKS